jgi:acetyltransferase-like isoleucine patch superfamily enzyme
MNLNKLALKIRRRETPFYDRLYLFLKSAQTIEVPVIPFFYKFLYAQRQAFKTIWHWLSQNFYYIPLFKTQCVSYGKNLKIIGGLPLIMGDLKIIMGGNCTLHGTTTLSAAKVFDDPTLRIGNNTYLGYALEIYTGCDITIGNNVMISNNVILISYDGHPTIPSERHGVAPQESSKPIVIEDNVWIGAKCSIMKGVTIGKNSVIGAGSVVTKNVPPDSFAVGNPVRVIPQKYRTQ